MRALFDVLALGVELAALAGLMRFAWLAGDSLWVKLGFAALALLGFGLIWGFFFSPKAPHRLEMPWLLLGKVVMLGIPLLLSWGKIAPAVVIGYAIALLLHLVWGAARGWL